MLQCNVVTSTFDLFSELEVEGVEKLGSNKTSGGTSLQKALQPLLQAQKEQTDKTVFTSGSTRCTAAHDPTTTRNRTLAE